MSALWPPTNLSRNAVKMLTSNFTELAELNKCILTIHRFNCCNTILQRLARRYGEDPECQGVGLPKSQKPPSKLNLSLSRRNLKSIKFLPRLSVVTCKEHKGNSRYSTLKGFLRVILNIDLTFSNLRGWSSTGHQAPYNVECCFCAALLISSHS